jgi:hypothetical protein
VLSNVAETRRTEQSITHGVRDGVSIAVAEQTALTIERDTCEHERAFVVSETMDIESLSDAHGSHG